MEKIRETFVETSRRAGSLVRSYEVEQRWEGPSALAEFSMKGLVGHLLRATGSVEAYLDRDEPSGEVVTASQYYKEAIEEPDIRSELHRSVRQRGEEAAAGGREAVLAEWDALLSRLEPRLETEPRSRRLRVYKDMVITLDQYLITRLVELVVHSDDVAVSAGIAPPALPPSAYDLAIGCLVDVGRLRHGDEAVMRALARRERDAVGALKVL